MFQLAILKENNYTLDDIYKLPEGQRAELIDGYIYDMAPPSRRDQRISFEISRKIADYIDEHQGTCEVNRAPFAVFLDENDKTYVEPDISVVCDENKLDDKGCNGAPDWIIEIVSPGSRRMDYGIKLFKYRSAGVREYWIVDPEKQRIIVYDLEHDDVEEYTFKDKIKARIYDELWIDFKNL